MTKTITILVAYHKPDDLINAPFFLPIHVGRTLSKEHLPMAGDDTGENISYKNGAYCELTAVYWAGFNLNSDYIGLCHYRRFFSFNPHKIHHILSLLSRIKSRIIKIVNLEHETIIWDQTICSSLSEVNRRCAAFSSIIEKSDFDAIFLQPLELGCHTVHQFFSEKIGSDPLAIIHHIINTEFPSFFSCYESVLAGTRMSPCNMFVMKSDIFGQYHNFIFSVLNKFESIYCHEINYANLAPPYHRLIGYLGELLTATFAYKYKSSHAVVFANILQYQPSRDKEAKAL
jgi:hypothetical protein